MGIAVLIYILLNLETEIFSDHEVYHSSAIIFIVFHLLLNAKDRMMDNAQNCVSYINTLSPESL
jgi:hypothetical protein